MLVGCGSRPTTVFGIFLCLVRHSQERHSPEWACTSSMVINKVEPIGEHLFGGIFDGPLPRWFWNWRGLGAYIKNQYRTFRFLVRQFGWRPKKGLCFNTETLEFEARWICQEPLKASTSRILPFKVITHSFWMTSGQSLYSLSIDHMELTGYGMDWLVDKFPPAKITDLNIGLQGRAYIGTDHGFYSLLINGLALVVPANDLAKWLI